MVSPPSLPAPPAKAANLFRPAADSRAEKPARATLFSAVNRAMGKETIVIADAMNYIKGSRYQMYCQAREVGVRTCTVSRPTCLAEPECMY